MRSNLATRNFGTTQSLVLVIAAALLTTIFWGNVFRFYPRLIDGTYDGTSEGVVIGRMTRAATDGFTSKNADLGVNVDLKGSRTGGAELFEDQKRFYEDPQLVGSLHLDWWPYASQFGLQGILFSTLELVNPLPRKWHLGFYHLLAALFCAGVLVWIAEILRRRFGWGAFAGFLVPIAIEPMFTALGPNLYWVVGTWFVPMAIAMHLADEEDDGRRFRLIAAAFVFFVIKCLCGYEFISTVILAAAAGCLLGVRDVPGRLSRILGNLAWIIAAGVTGFVVAVLAHAAKEGGFAVIFGRAAVRIMGDAASLGDEIHLGKYATMQSVIFRYLEGGDVTLNKYFWIPLGLFVLAAVLALLDEKIVWCLGHDRRKLQILALAFLASLAAPLSWFVLAKGHSFVHTHINFILWYLPTFPLGGALIGMSLSQTFENRAAWAANDARRTITIAVPSVIVLAIAGILIADRQIQTTGGWVLAAHSRGIPLFESDDLGIEFRMTDQWFTLQYDCRAAATTDSFFIDAYQGAVATNYDFNLADNQIYARKNRCFYARPKADLPYQRVDFGVKSKGTRLWQRQASIAIPEAFTLDPLTDAEWDHGILRASGTELLLQPEEFGSLFLRKGDRLQFASSGSRTITAITTVSPYKWLRVDAPVTPADIGGVPIRIIRQ